MVATLYVWAYEGGAEGSPEAARRGEQRCYAGDLGGGCVTAYGCESRVSGLCQ